ncbi:acid protease [Dichomitus squalens LYAD-421 SS1]|uniref:acid protease n=1 Tax=Dichomitus squalens (strain LYAD-421) TaxID=732165 RepID=UPI0004410781|nr:acid protease [Dichomitus squalens LYAD-421 SS1]EJF64945.1 acid protease [Dichomitus squalens LYAD-421 SS1]
MLPLFLVLSILSFLDASCYASTHALPRWRPDLRRRGAGKSGIHARNTLEGIATNTPTQNSTIVPIAFSSDKSTYYALATIGNVNLRLALDTASADLWVVSSNCTTSQCNLPKYPLAFQSPTFVSVNSNTTAFGVSYADGTGAAGFIARESVSIGNLTVPTQAFGLAGTSNVTFKDDVSGVLGLGFPRLSDISGTISNATPFFASLAQNGSLDYPVFGLSLTRDTSGTLTFGAIDGSIVANRSLVELNEVVPFAPFGSQGNSSSYLQWAIVLDGISVNGTSLTPEPTYPVQTMNNTIALIDVGTAGIFGPYQDVARIFSMIDSARLVDDTTGQYVLPCDTQETLSFNFGGRDFVLQPTDYIIGPAAENPNLCLSWPRALPPSSDGIDWQFGSAFLRTVYSIYSFGINTKEPPMIGFYPLSNATTVTETPQQVSSFLASASATVPTTLPNFLISVPTFSTPSYTFNASISAPVGKIVATGLATSTYVPLLGSHNRNATAIPTLTPSPTVATLILTDTSGHTVTTTSTASERSITLGSPAAGWSNGARGRARSVGFGGVVGALSACALLVW